VTRWYGSLRLDDWLWRRRLVCSRARISTVRWPCSVCSRIGSAEAGSVGTRYGWAYPTGSACRGISGGIEIVPRVVEFALVRCHQHVPVLENVFEHVPRPTQTSFASILAFVHGGVDGGTLEARGSQQPSKGSVYGAKYARYCSEADEVKRSLELADFVEFDAHFSYAYWP
jgi:hypothetical protein